MSPVVDPLKPEPDELVLNRIHGMSAFYGTPLEPALRDRGVTTIVATGVSLNIGIIATTVEALNRGLRIVSCTSEKRHGSHGVGRGARKIRDRVGTHPHLPVETDI